MMSAQAAAVRISELEAEIQAKDNALAQAKAYLQAVHTDIERLEAQSHLSCSQYTLQLEDRLTVLQTANAQLRALHEAQFEQERLKLELEHGQQLRTTFEAKFKQAKVQLLGLQSASDPQYAQLQRENEALRREIAALRANPPAERSESLEKELQTLRSCYQRLSLEARQETTAYAQHEDLPETPRVLYQTPPALLSEAPSRSRSKPESQGSPVSTSKMSAVSTASYCPSFLRRSKASSVRVQGKKPPCSKYLRLDSQRETFEGVDPV